MKAINFIFVPITFFTLIQFAEANKDRDEIADAIKYEKTKSIEAFESTDVKIKSTGIFGNHISQNAVEDKSYLELKSNKSIFAQNKNTKEMWQNEAETLERSAPQRLVASEGLIGDSENSWIKSYLKAKNKCKELEALKNQEPPTEESKGLLNLRYIQKCTKEDSLKTLEYDWLKKDAIFVGLRGIDNPDLFLKYYKEYQNLPYASRQDLEFFERASLYRKILPKVDRKKQTKTFEALLDLFPAFYVNYKVTVPEKSMFEAGYGLRMMREFKSAQDIYRKIIEINKKKLSTVKSVSVKQKILNDIYKAYGFLRITYRVSESKPAGILQFQKGISFFEDYYKNNPKKEFAFYYIDSVVQLARDIWTEGNVKKARKMLLNVEGMLLGRGKNKGSLDQVYWVLGRMNQEKKDYKSAVNYFEKALKESPEKDFKLKLLWLIAWNQKKSSLFEDSLESFGRLEKESLRQKDDSYFYKSLFWQAQVQLILKNNKKAGKILEKISKENKFGYYGRLALLEGNPEEFSKTFQSREDKIFDTSLDKEIEKNIQIFFKMDEQSIASEYLKYKWSHLGSWKRKGIKARIQFLTWSEEAELYKDNQQLIEVYGNDTKDEILEMAPYLLFPKPYEGVAQKYATQFKVPVELVYSLMRQESLFDRKARSPADAFGLLQLIMSNAKKHTEEVGLKSIKPEDLYRPEVILPLGIAHISSLLKMKKKLHAFNGSKL